MAEKIIFNSMGSNYDWREANSLRGIKPVAAADLSWRKALGVYLGVNETKISLFYKGREALWAGLKALGLPPQTVIGVTAFTCSVVENSVTRAGLKPFFLDLKPNSLNFSLASLEKAEAHGVEFGAIILQNTFGYQMDELKKIGEWARKRNIFLIEDLAHGLGLNYQDLSGTFLGPIKKGGEKNETRAGTFGDVTIFSFSQDKMLDVVSGGALLINNEKLLAPLSEEMRSVAPIQQLKDRFYPSFSSLIRDNYWWGGGKIAHWILKKSRILSNPMSFIGDDEFAHSMTWWQAAQAEKNWRKDWFDQLNRRREKAYYYFKNLSPEWQVSGLGEQQIQAGACLRWPLLVPEEKREELINYLAAHGIYISDIWYSSVIAPKSAMSQSTYRSNSCLEAERVCAKIINLPTHRQVDMRQCEKIVRLINNYLID